MPTSSIARRKPETSARPTLAAALVALVELVACERPEAPMHRVRFAVKDDRGHPVRGAELHVDGRTVGRTNRDGTLEIRRRGQEGDSVRIRTLCPDGYRGPKGSVHRELRAVRPVSGSRPAASIRFTGRCKRRQRTVALVVRSGRAKLPVRVEGRIRAHTDDRGTAHVLLKRPPHGNVHVRLDTRGRPALRPRSPERTFRLDDADALWLFEPAFHATRRRARHRKPREADRPVPYRLR